MSTLPTLDAVIAGLVEDPNEHLNLGPLADDHVTTVSEAEAKQKALAMLNLPGPALYEAHGTDLWSPASPSVWLVIAKVPAMEPFPVGPSCPPPPASGCSQNWAVNDYAGALISDTTGELDRSFATMRPVAAPSIEPTESTAPSLITPQISPCSFFPGELSVKFTPQVSDSSEQDAFAAVNGLREISRAANIGWIRYQITDGKSELDKAAELLANPMIENAIPILVCPVEY